MDQTIHSLRSVNVATPISNEALPSLLDWPRVKKSEPFARNCFLPHFLSSLLARTRLLETWVEPGTPEQDVVFEVREKIASFDSWVNLSSEDGKCSAWSEAHRLQLLLLLAEPGERLISELEYHLRIADKIGVKEIADLRLAAHEAISCRVGGISKTICWSRALEVDLRFILIEVISKIQRQFIKKHLARGFLTQLTRRTLIAALISFLLFVFVYMANVVNGYHADMDTKSAFTAIRLWQVDIPLLSCLTAGLFGSYFSRLLYIQMYSTKFGFDELLWTRHRCVIFVRGAIGVCGAAVLFFVLRSGIVSAVITTSLVPKFEYLAFNGNFYISNKDLALLVIWGFFAGFSERLVPSILATTEGRLVTTESKKDETAKRTLRRSVAESDSAELVFSILK
jgi:hypothetical protein